MDSSDQRLMGKNNSGWFFKKLLVGLSRPFFNHLSKC